MPTPQHQHFQVTSPSTQAAGWIRGLAWVWLRAVIWPYIAQSNTWCKSIPQSWCQHAFTSQTLLLSPQHQLQSHSPAEKQKPLQGREWAADQWSWWKGGWWHPLASWHYYLHVICLPSEQNSSKVHHWVIFMFLAMSCTLPWGKAYLPLLRDLQRASQNKSPAGFLVAIQGAAAVETLGKRNSRLVWSKRQWSQFFSSAGKIQDGLCHATAGAQVICNKTTRADDLNKAI